MQVATRHALCSFGDHFPVPLFTHATRTSTSPRYIFCFFYKHVFFFVGYAVPPLHTCHDDHELVAWITSPGHMNRTAWSNNWRYSFLYIVEGMIQTPTNSSLEQIKRGQNQLIFQVVINTTKQYKGNKRKGIWTIGLLFQLVQRICLCLSFQRWEFQIRTGGLLYLMEWENGRLLYMFGFCASSVLIVSQSVMFLKRNTSITF